MFRFTIYIIYFFAICILYTVAQILNDGDAPYWKVARNHKFVYIVILYDSINTICCGVCTVELPAHVMLSSFCSPNY